MIIFASSIFNLFRLIFLLLLCIALYPFFKNKSIYFFLKLSGPSFIKLGQTLSTRPDLVGEPLSKTLSSFQDSLTPFSCKSVKKILVKEFGENFQNIFHNFNFTAKASASIAQVHQANIIVNGKIQKVAVKILRPNIKKIVNRDIHTLDLIIKIAYLFNEFFAKNLKEINDVLKLSAKTELNLLKEASNATRLKEELKTLKEDGVLFYTPKIFLKFSSKDILVSEWIEGIPFSNMKEILSSKYDKKNIAKSLVISYFTQVYSNGFFHADMHPGNLFLMTEGENAGYIGIVDFGIVGEINKKTRIIIAKILIGFLQKNYHEVAKLHIQGGFVDKDVSIYNLAISCEKIGEKIVGANVKDISLANLLMQLIEMTKEYNMKADPNLLLLQKTLLLVEGVAVMLDSNVNIWNLAEPWVEKWGKHNIGFDAKILDFANNLLENIKSFLNK